ncbi:MAG TPA: MBL fold metallo-hydrolase [Thermosynergistes sp.]|nr:MBL fold metallo-hydrolase [Thermosynergistes sp.]
MAKTGSLTLYEDASRRFMLLGWEEQEEGGVVQTNQYLIQSGDEVILLDPGGAHVFPRVLANVTEMTNIDNITHIFYSHQDPDVSSGITLWLSMAERATVHISGLWTRFLPHFGVFDQSRIAPIPDRGGVITLKNGQRLEIIPAHFLHSTGQHTLYDPISKILFSGDIGAAIFPPGKRYPVVERFDEHVRYMEGFHRRYMVSQEASSFWVNIVSSRDIEAIAPQHGAVIKGKDNVRKFFQWLGQLKSGVDLIEEWYGTKATLAVRK